MTPRRVAAGAAGFTLVEVILSLVIFSLLVTGAYSAFDYGHRAVRAGEKQADMNQRMRVAEEIIGRQIRAAVIQPAAWEDDQTWFFIGRPDAVSFVTASPQGQGGLGLAVVTYRVVEHSLVLQERAIFTTDDLYEPPADARVQEAVILRDFESLKFEYLPHEDLEGQWQGAWDARDEDNLPAGIRMSVTGLQFFDGHPWVYQAPLMSVAYGWGDDFLEPPDDDLEDEDEEEDEDTEDEEDTGDEDMNDGGGAGEGAT
jgi:type II secretion system protein J